jgi:ribosomal protein L34E
MVLKKRGCLKSLRISRKVSKDESDAKNNCWLLNRCDRCFPGVRCEKILLRISRKVRKDESDAKNNCWLLKRCDRCFPGVRCEKILLTALRSHSFFTYKIKSIGILIFLQKKRLSLVFANIGDRLLFF